MSIAVNADARIKEALVDDERITFRLMDGRIVSVPLAWSWRLSEATLEQRNNYRIIAEGKGVHWPDIDEDLSIEGMFKGIPAHRPSGPTTDKGR